MRAYLCDPALKSVTEIDFDGEQETLCELLGQPVENIDCFRMNDDPACDESFDDELEFYCLLSAKPAGVDLEKDALWSFGKFDGRHCWEVGIIGRMLLCGSRGIAGGGPLEPHSSTMSLEQAKSYCEFMRDDLVTIPMGNAVMLAGKGAPDEVRAMAAGHNARPEVRETMKQMERAGFGEMSPRPWQKPKH